MVLRWVFWIFISDNDPSLSWSDMLPSNVTLFGQMNNYIVIHKHDNI